MLREPLTGFWAGGEAECQTADSIMTDPQQSGEQELFSSSCVQYTRGDREGVTVSQSRPAGSGTIENIIQRITGLVVRELVTEIFRTCRAEN